MTITNRELFFRDPTKTKIPNDGVAKVIRPQTDQQWEVLVWELSSFVCNGQYARGLERILESFLANLSQAQQPAVWVSGFYGSGKSHLARVLEHLWCNAELPDGRCVRDIVSLPDEVRDHLTELSTAGKRLGGLWSAAGTLGAGKNDAVRLAFLSIIFESAGLPEEYALARFILWAQENGYLEAVRAAVEANGRSLDKEVHNLYVSPIIAKSLLELDATLGNSIKDVRDLLKAQFPPMVTDITDEEMFDVMDDVLRLQSTSEGKLPLTLIVLDELQQYIQDDSEKALAVQNLVEGCSARFQSQVLFVSTGQSALTATPTLQKLTDRFAVQVSLSDKDVETVIREVVLRKRPEQVPMLKSALESVSGEIDKHLGGTHLATKAADKPDLVPDYPLLPTRRRFWELALRAIDRAGKAGVLRTQLRTVHEAAARVADAPVGHVVGADFLYEEQAPGMLQSGVLLKEIDELIRGLRAEGEDGALKSRICALVFLISQIPSRTVAGETGLRATAPFLADLMVEDLVHDGARLRKRIPELLEALVTDGRLMRIDDEYRLQTEEGAEWEKEFQSRLAVIRDDSSRINQLRTERLAAAVDKAMGGLKLPHGASKTPRTLDIHWGQDEPAARDNGVPVWIRDEWSVALSAVKRSAAEAGDESPIVFVLLPKYEAERIKESLASYAAAEDTLRRPTPQTDEGKAAQRAMRTRLATDEERLTTLFREATARARVFQGGGAEVTVSTLHDAVQTTATRSLVRLYPKFSVGDNAYWGKVVTKARDGAPDALEAVGHHGELTTHPVCKEVLAAISPSGTKGADVQRRFAAPPYGWPKDAVNGAILALLAAGNIRAVQDGKDLAGPKELPPTQIGKVTVYKEDEPPSTSQRFAVRGLLSAAGIPYEPGQEGAQLSGLIQRLKDLAARAGGLPPLPEAPNTTHLNALLALGGNQQFRAIADSYARLSKELDLWRSADREREKREGAWQNLQRLLRHAEGLPIAATFLPAIQAIHDGRQLLDAPDPVPPVLNQLTRALHDVVVQRVEQLASAQRDAVAELEAWEEWGKLSPLHREAILTESKLSPVEGPDLSTTAKLLEVLDAIPLSAWQDRISLVPGRRDQARLRAAKMLEPTSITVAVPSATIKTTEDLERYLDDLRNRVHAHLDAGKTVIL
ncbi:BREX system P-loop protein BrxC [Sphaerisporangium sp. B11E5]|uniref:BREX system P-loop protein BrxC n=1 Tax=Sphaerisporangium sp. B11E5 TaxID=3153563 RepID=UPI00325D4149